MKDAIFHFIPRLALLLSLVCIATPLRAADDDLQTSKKNLAEIEQRIKDTAKNLAAKKSAEQALAEELKKVDVERARIERRIAASAQRLSGLDKEIGAQQELARQAKTEISDLDQQVRRRLAALYKGGEVGLLQVVFSSTSPARIAEDYDYFKRIMQRDRALLAEYRRKLSESEQALTALADLQRKQKDLLADRREEEAALRQALRIKEEALGKVRRDKASLAANLAELKERAARMTGLIKKLESAKTREYSGKSTLFAGQKGRLPWPVSGPLRVGFGSGIHPTLGTQYDSHGIEVGVDGEKPISAIWSGRVIFANWFKGYGNLIIVDHGDKYYTLYAQASRLTKKVGDPVKQGEPVAYSGYEGSRTVYFEIRHRGNPLDPKAWLAPR